MNNNVTFVVTNEFLTSDLLGDRRNYLICHLTSHFILCRISLHVSVSSPSNTSIRETITSTLFDLLVGKSVFSAVFVE